MLGDSVADMRHSPSRTTRQLGFMALPSDIILEIFEHLTQEDCLTCMAVCRDWYYMIPQYAQSAWKFLRLDKYDIEKENQCVARCLGDHVKSVVLEGLGHDEAVYRTMLKLLDWGCTKIESLELYECKSENQDVFLSLLKKLAPHLTHLKMVHHHSNVAFLHVFSVCPELTQFTYQKTSADPKDDLGVYDKEPVVLDAGSTHGPFSKITHLCFDAIMDRELRLDPILKRCPNLLVFVGPTLSKYGLKYFPYSRLSINFDLLFDWCPKLAWIEDVLSHHTLPDFIDDPDIGIIDSGLAGLRHLSVCELSQDSVQQHLTDSQDTLKFLAINPWIITRNRNALPAMLKTLQLTQLQTLIIHNSAFDDTSIVSLLNHCPSLHTLDLKYENFELNPSTVSRFNPMSKLRNLSWAWIYFVGNLSLLTLLERFPSLETLSLYRLTAPATFPEGCEGPRQLKTLKLLNIEWKQYDNHGKEASTRLLGWFAMYSKLEAISILCVSNFGISSLPVLGKIATLETLEVGLHEDSECGEAEETSLHQFASSLAETKIMHISVIDSSFHFPEKVVNKLNELPVLELYVFHPRDPSHCNQCSIPWK